MELVLEVFNYVFAAILFGVTIAWIILIKSMIISFRDVPYLDKFDLVEHGTPKVSIKPGNAFDFRRKWF